MGILGDWTNQFSRCDRIEVLFYYCSVVYKLDVFVMNEFVFNGIL